MINHSQSSECIAFASVVGFFVEEIDEEIWSIGDEILQMGVDARNCPDSILSDVYVPMLQALPGRVEQGFEDFLVSELGEESEGIAANIFVGVLKV
jgi:hypothetical protein